MARISFTELTHSCGWVNFWFKSLETSQMKREETKAKNACTFSANSFPIV